ncbi:MAG TPA: glycoside hydrolase family 2 TIM barrel-domain containing protein [Chthonomonadales bacterium]|nr:glycoside hydrolase family 2 TIM barrel-domain containing protein [Chthonomonadales bacterium]
MSDTSHTRRDFLKGATISSVGLAALSAEGAMPAQAQSGAASAETRPTSVPRPEHPRPIFRRDAWTNLNGRWQFEIDEAGDGEARGLTSGRDLETSIIVPFAPESQLSGIGNRDFMTNVWYRRHFRLPAAMQGRRVLLHFGAVDWLTRVWVNGRLMGDHRGGYVPFSFEITEALRPGDNELVVHAFDDTRSGTQATGKQSHTQESQGVHYTRTTGIWQTVWLEAVGDTYLRDFAVTPDVAGGRLLFEGTIDGPMRGLRLRLRARANGRPVGEETVVASWREARAALKLSRVTLWHPGKPFLYDLDIEVLRGQRVVDHVRTYFGMRSLAIEGNRFLINGQPVFQRLVLDQGFYPDGVYTASSDAALRRDIELSMAAGFNGARLHQKVFEPRLLHWADRLGYLLWGEYPSWGLNFSDRTAVAYAVAEWFAAVRRDRNNPAIIGWCPLNETPAGEPVAEAQQLLAVTRDVDPSRPFLATSGWVHYDPETDVYGCHDYDQNPQSFAARHAPFATNGVDAWNNFPADPRSAYRGQPFLLGEFGGMRIRPRAAGPDGAWGYSEVEDVRSFMELYRALTDVPLGNPNMCGFCYTQITDVEQEQNGVFYYDRRAKYDPAMLKALNERPAAYETQPPRIRRIDWTEVVPTSERVPQIWRYTMAAPAAGWEQAGFDDSAWASGPGGFGTRNTPGAVVGTEWSGPSIWLRRTFTLDAVGGPLLALRVHHDEDADVYVNGRRVVALRGFTQGYRTMDLTEALRAALRPGANLFAVHCMQRTGGQFIDVGLRSGVERRPRP